MKLRLALICATSLLLGACATTGVNPNSSAFQSSFKSGNFRLECGLACAGTAGADSAKKRNLYNNGLWADLVNLVATGGQNSNLDYYYLGAGAEGLGFFDAAITYYKLALAATYKCSGSICVGFVFPNEINNRLAYVLNRKAQVDRQKAIANQPQVKSSSVNPPSTSATDVSPNRLEGLYDGNAYRYSKNCTASNCISIELYKKVCQNLGGVANGAFSSLAAQSMDSEKATILYGELKSVEFNWNQNREACVANLKLSYPQNAASPAVRAVGIVDNFAYNNGTKKFTAIGITKF